MTRPTGEQGFSLIELLVAMSIIGILVIGCVGGIATLIAASDRHRKQADAHVTLVGAAERVKSSQTPHVPCASPSDYLGAARSHPLPAGWQASEITVVEVRYWNGTSFGNACMEDTTKPVPLALQLVTLGASKADGRATQSLTFVKR